MPAMSSTISRFFTLVGLVCFLCSCGFHLRGPILLPLALKKIYVDTLDPYGELTRNIKQALQNSHVSLATNAASAYTVLHILQEVESQQLLSVGGTQQTRQYNLILAVTFEVTTPAGKILLPTQTVTETQALTVQANRILGGSNEQNNLYRQMRRAIVYTLLNRLAAKDAAQIILTNQASHPLVTNG